MGVHVLCICVQIGELLSQDVLLTSEGSGQNSFSNITGNIREVCVWSVCVCVCVFERKEKRVGSDVCPLSPTGGYMLF